MEKLNIIMLNHISINKRYINTDKNIKEFNTILKNNQIGYIYVGFVELG